MLCPVRLVLRDVLGTAGRPQKAVKRWHKENLVLWDPRSLVDRFEHMPVEVRGPIIAIVAALVCFPTMLWATYNAAYALKDLIEALNQAQEGAACPTYRAHCTQRRVGRLLAKVSS